MFYWAWQGWALCNACINEWSVPRMQPCSLYWMQSCFRLKLVWWVSDTSYRKKMMLNFFLLVHVSNLEGEEKQIWRKAQQQVTAVCLLMASKTAVGSTHLYNSVVWIQETTLSFYKMKDLFNRTFFLLERFDHSLACLPLIPQCTLAPPSSPLN